ncbi:MAG: ADP-forming succinate--CoA ligase subunit beta [Desulfobulbaceae bacterium]|nr:MAG: ADP-forming succinate--CoA ligase subunit beta [Desulfobulbaceae bacterium]
MKIHEYQAKELFARADIAVPRGRLATTRAEAMQAVTDLGGYPVVIKAQIHAGGRGKGGGVRLAHNHAEAEAACRDILGMQLVTPQTGAAGKRVEKILVEEGLTISRELYLAMLPDRDTATIMIMASTQGGMDIEEVAAHSPEKIMRVAVNPLLGLQPYQVRRLVYGLGFTGAAAASFSSQIYKLYALMVARDCSLLEINPLVVTSADQVVALDAKLDVDGNSLYRHADIALMRDETEEDPLEVEASRHNLNYINLDGTIGNMVNGAGLAMATMDIIKQAGAEPANFLDVGGGASADMVEQGFRLILSDERVMGILINIFGGILRCDVLAEGVVQAARAVDIKVPVVIRMEGTNVEQGRAILADSGLNLITATDLADAAAKVAAIAG